MSEGRSRPGLNENDDNLDDMEGTPPMITSSDMQSDHDAESTTGAAQIEDETDAMDVDQLTAGHGNAVELVPIRTKHTKIWLEQMYPMISWMLVPQTPPTQAVAGEASKISPVFPSFTAVQITPALPATTQMSPGTPMWIPGTPESPHGVYGQEFSQHANIRSHGTPPTTSKQYQVWSSPSVVTRMLTHHPAVQPSTWLSAASMAAFSISPTRPASPA